MYCLLTRVAAFVGFIIEIIVGIKLNKTKINDPTICNKNFLSGLFCEIQSNNNHKRIRVAINTAINTASGSMLFLFLFLFLFLGINLI